MGKEILMVSPDKAYMNVYNLAEKRYNENLGWRQIDSMPVSKEDAAKPVQVEEPKKEDSGDSGELGKFKFPTSGAVGRPKKNGK